MVSCKGWNCTHVVVANFLKNNSLHGFNGSMTMFALLKEDKTRLGLEPACFFTFIIAEGSVYNNMITCKLNS